MRSLPGQTPLSLWLSGPCPPWKQDGQTAIPPMPGSASLRVTQALLGRVGMAAPRAVSAPPQLPCPSLPAPSTFPWPFPWPLPAAPCQCPSGPQLCRGQSARQAVISSVLNSPLHLHYTGPKHYWRGRTRPVPTDPSTWDQSRACRAVLKDQTSKIPSYSQQSLPDHFPYAKCQYKNNEALAILPGFCQLLSALSLR